VSEQRFSRLDQYAFWEAYARKCSSCNTPTRFPPVIDHIVPETLGAKPDELEKIRLELGLPADFDLESDLNLRPTCAMCNSQKGYMVPDPNLLNLPLSRVEIRIRDTKALPHGNYPILRALFAGLCARKPLAADQWLVALERHFEKRESPEVWSALLFQEMFWLRHADRGRSQQLVEKVFGKYPQLLQCDSGVYFIGANHKWLSADFVHSCLREWEDGTWNRGPQAAAEVCMYRYALVPDDQDCKSTIERILTGESIDPSKLSSMRLGMAFSFGELWNHPTTRDRSNPILIRFMPLGEGRAAEALGDIFRLCDSLPADKATRDLLDALVACPVCLRDAGGGFLVDRLKDLIADGNEAERVCNVASGIVRTSQEPSAFQHRLSHAADGLVEIALTLQRLPATRSCGVQLFEDLMDFDVYSVSTTLSELDRRISAQ